MLFLAMVVIANPLTSLNRGAKLASETDLYFCATFRTEQSKAFNLRLEERFKAEGYSCFLAQRDSDQRGDRKRTFLEDVAGIDHARVVVAMGAYLQSANWGFELGYCYAKRKPVVALTSADRPLDLMTAGSVEEIVIAQDIEDIDSYFEDLLSRVKRKLKL
jgi:nucleoside 2-deoxyribosyltransferase